MDHTPRELARRAPGHAVTLARRWAARQYRRLYFWRRPDHPALDAETARRRLHGADSVLFLCWGNICRSPFAERLLRRRLDGGVSVASAGLGTASERPSPEAAVAAAARRGVDLSDHRSTLATPALLDDHDVVFVMDYNNYHSAVGRFPGAASRTHFLGALTGGDVVVPDPHGADADTFDAVYDDVTDAVARVAAALAE